MVRPWKNLVLVPSREGVESGDQSALFAYPGGDSYWQNRIRKTLQQRDEPELWFVLNTFVDEDTIFIDGGANMGVWSCVVASIINKPSQVVAVEPSPEILRHLRQNSRLNNNGFTIIDRALWDQPGQSLPFNEYSSLNALNSLYPMSRTRTPNVTTVSTTTVDDIIKGQLQGVVTQTNNIIIKLDIEKSELHAISGASDTLRNHNCLIAYEDHRDQDPDAELTADILNDGMHVYYVDPSNSVRAIQHSEELHDIRTPPRRGYIFLATMPDSRFDKDLNWLCHKGTQPLPAHTRFIA